MSTPPIAVLERMLALRVHLDDCDVWNGALRVMAGSHQSGRLSPEAISECIKSGNPRVCTVKKGRYRSDETTVAPLI
jgi:hypothetical protein